MNGQTLPIVFLAPNEQDVINDDFHLKARLGFSSKSSFDKSLAKSLAIQSADPKIQQLTADQILEKAQQSGVGGYQTSRQLQDWVVSRQRAWGTPIPIILDRENDNICRPMPTSLLPVLTEQRGQLMPNNGSMLL